MLDWQSEIEGIYEKHRDRIEKCASDCLLYHYTSPLGVLGILDSQKIWMSDSDYLNDSSESYYFYEVYHEADRKERESRKEENFKLNAGVLPYFHSSQYSRKRITSERMPEKRYVVSLSLDKDNLGLWNYYTKTPGNVGYNIGFENRILDSAFLKEYDIVQGKVIYDHETQIMYLQELIDDYWDLYQKLRHTYQRRYLFQKLERNIVLYSVFMKDSAFKYENEYRYAIIAVGDTKLSRLFREVNGAFVPYVTAPIDITAIREVGISPTHRMGYVARSLEELLLENDITAEVYTSNIPLRY